MSTMVRAEEEEETMRPCGCQAGRPCTCEMGKRTASAQTFACGVCVNCRLNARKATRTRKGSSGTRRCLKSAEYLANLAFDQVILRGGCVFRMRKPDWNVTEKTHLFNQIHQMRLAMVEARAVSLAAIDSQKILKLKYSNDLQKAEDAIKKLESINLEAGLSTKKMTTEQLCVDSDVFDSFSKQLVAAETLVPDLQMRLEKSNASISREQKHIKIIHEHVRDFAVRILQSSTRQYFRLCRWKKALRDFHEDVRMAAAVEIQATWRMCLAKKLRVFLAQLLEDLISSNAASVIQRFSLMVIKEKRRKKMEFAKKAEAEIAARKQTSLNALYELFGRHVLYNALAVWKECTRTTKILAGQKSLASALLIQRVYRGFRDRVYLKRIRIRTSLSDRVGALVDQFIVSGDFWGFVLKLDADYRRFSHKIAQEEEDAATFMSSVIRQRKLDEDQMMQDWFTASALQNPLVRGVAEVSNTYSSEEGNSSNGSSVSQAMLQSALVDDLVALSPNKRKDDIFPPDFPPKTIRQAMAKGFALDEVIAVMRGLQAQRRDIEDADLVVATLKKRSPLMTNPWKSERVLRELRYPGKASCHLIPDAKPDYKPLPKKAASKRPAVMSANLLESIPGGMNAPIARLLLVAALRCYDAGKQGKKGRIVPCSDRKSPLFESYIITESPLVKIRTEQQAMEAMKPFLNILLENRCYTAYDILYSVRGIGELISWNIPGPLAKSIYSVIQEIHMQSTHISKRNIIREGRISADYERFLKAKEREKLLSTADATAKENLKQSGTIIEYPDPEDRNTMTQVKLRLETEVLRLPLQDISIPACELLFKAAFLADVDTENPTTADTYHNFLHSLLKFQAAGDTEAMKQLIAARVIRAKAIADGHTDMFQLFAVTSASDLLTNNLVQVLIRDQPLQQKVIELLDPFTIANGKTPLQLDGLVTNQTTVSPNPVKLASLSPLIRHGKTPIT